MTASNPQERQSSAQPLAGVTVVAVEQAVAAPLATRHLADLGARVIKIEHIDGGDLARRYNADVRGMSSFFVWLNRSKESLAVDLKKPAGLALVRRLIARSDVFVQNLSPDAAERLGLGAEALRRETPRLITVWMSGYGSDGPDRHRRAYDMLVQGEAAVTAVTGTSDAPAKAGIAVADIAAGMYAYSGVLAALLRRDRYDVGSSIEVSMFDAMAEWMGYPLNVARYTGREPGRLGVAHASLVPYDAFPTSDGIDVLIGVQNDVGWRRLAQALDRHDLAADPRYATNIDRVARRHEVNQAVAEASALIPAETLIQRLEAAGVPAGRLNTVLGLLSHPQLIERKRWTEVDSEVGPVAALLPPTIFDGLQPRMDPIPSLGADTDRILLALGFSAEDTEELRETEVVG